MGTGMTNDQIMDMVNSLSEDLHIAFKNKFSKGQNFSGLEIYKIGSAAFANLIATFVTSMFDTDTLQIKSVEDILLTTRKLIYAINNIEKQLQ